MAAKTQRDRRKDREANRRFWQAHVKTWRKSGYSRAEYCRMNNLSYDALTYWQQRTGIAVPPKDGNSIIPVAQISAGNFPMRPATAPSMTVDLKGRFQIKVTEDFSPNMLTRLINTLEAC
jgi:hypothetical protein